MSEAANFWHSRALPGAAPNVYFGLNGYAPICAMGRPSLEAHGPPPPVAKLLGVPSCCVTCPICAQGLCLRCIYCPYHCDYHDPTLTVIILKEDPETPKPVRSFFCLGDRAYNLEGGAMFIFDASKVPHGVWTHPDLKSKDRTLRGCAIVDR